MRNRYGNRIGQLRRHRDLAMRKARWARERMVHAKFDHERFAARLALVRHVVHARCNNHAILMWQRLGRPAG